MMKNISNNYTVINNGLLGVPGTRFDRCFKTSLNFLDFFYYFNFFIIFFLEATSIKLGQMIFRSNFLPRANTGYMFRRMCTTTSKRRKTFHFFAAGAAVSGGYYFIRDYFSHLSASNVHLSSSIDTSEAILDASSFSDELVSVTFEAAKDHAVYIDDVEKEFTDSGKETCQVVLDKVDLVQLISERIFYLLQSKQQCYITP